MSQAPTAAAAEPAIGEAVAALRAGELVVFPTETLYGIGCDALDRAALERLRRAKRRPEEKGIAMILGGSEQVELVAEAASPAARALMAAFWPGPVVLLLPARPGLPDPLVVDGRVGARVSSHPVAARLARALGRPIAAPSANPAGELPARDVSEARAYFGRLVSVYLDGGTIEGAPSTLVDPGPPLRVVREGVVPARAIEAALGEAHPATPR